LAGGDFGWRFGFEILRISFSAEKRYTFWLEKFPVILKKNCASREAFGRA
jgi:hypothetical protein